MMLNIYSWQLRQRIIAVFAQCIDESGAKNIFHLTWTASSCNILHSYRRYLCFTYIYRDLRKQPRIKIHLNLFASLSFACAVCIIWYSWVHLDLVTKTDISRTVRSRNSVRLTH